MKVTFLGAAGTTTGSMHLIEVNGSRILLDCGLYQGRRKEAFERNRNLSLEPSSIDVVILSHAHIDHSGNLPTLVKNGFKGRIISTNATRDLCDIMLRDSAYLQVRDVEYVNKKRQKQGKNLFEPLYKPEDIDAVMKRFVELPYKNDFEVANGVKLRLNDAGHLLGAATVSLDITENGSTKRLMFTGDLGRKDMPIIRDPDQVKDVDWLITESTYGNREHPPKADVKGRLKAFVEDIQSQHAKLIIPSFSVGRTQTIVYFLREIYEEGRITDIPVFVDSPLSSKATEVYENHHECYDADTWKLVIEGEEPFQFHHLKYITDVEDSKKLNNMSGPAIIISASGMCEGGRILHHLKNNIENPRNIILIVGYQAQHTLGRRLVDKVSPVNIFGESYRLEARVHTINALSSHADRHELKDFFNGMGRVPQRAFAIHGEEEQTGATAQILRDLGCERVDTPAEGDTFEL